MRSTASLLIGLLLVMGSSAGASAAPKGERKRLGAAVTPIRLVPRGSTIAVGGLNHYLGTVELRGASDGILVVNKLSLEKYLLGLAEVPRDWPREALRAQAVAARSFALYTVTQPPVGDAATYGFDICASTNCQVFSGADVLRDSGGAAWQDAVDSTAGQVVLYEGGPILARYHSTSGGETLDNEDAFEGDPSYPYLQGVPSPWEQAAPLFRWQVRFKLRDLQAMLTRLGWWIDDYGKLIEAHTEPVKGRHYPNILFQGETGFVRTDTEEFRDGIRELAPQMFPGMYPSPSPSGVGTLPETLPSERYQMATRDKVAFVLGRGWGHGTGMSQWGAYGLASEGASYADILLHYYTDVALGTVSGRSVDVGVGWGLSSVLATGEFDIVDGRGRRLVRRALGTWRFVSSGTGVVEIDPPIGFGLPLRVGLVDSPQSVPVGGAASLTVALSRPAKVTTQTLEAPTGFADPGTKIRNGGRRKIPWLAPLEPGTYQVRVTARAGPTSRVSETVEIEVVSAPLVDPVPLSEDEGSIPLLYVVIALAGVLVLVLGVASYLAGKRRPPN